MRVLVLVALATISGCAGQCQPCLPNCVPNGCAESADCGAPLECAESCSTQCAEPTCVAPCVPQCAAPVCAAPAACSDCCSEACACPPTVSGTNSTQPPILATSKPLPAPPANVATKPTAPAKLPAAPLDVTSPTRASTKPLEPWTKPTAAAPNCDCEDGTTPVRLGMPANPIDPAPSVLPADDATSARNVKFKSATRRLRPNTVFLPAPPRRET